MLQFFTRLIGFLGAAFSFYSLIDFEKGSFWINGILILSCLVVAFLFIIDAWQAFKSRTRSFNRKNKNCKNKIADYLLSQLSSVGSVVIFSKDLTWVKDNVKAKTILTNKAIANELTMFLEDKLPISTELSSKGAEVYYYTAQSKKNFKPTSRFTILDSRSAKPRVMVGTPYEEKHIIKHYGNDDTEIVELALDFVSLLRATSKK